MLENSNVELAKHRLTNAKENYLAAEELIKNGYYKVANNRAYYSIFHAMRAVLALVGIDFKKHSGVISYFNQHYIKPGKIDKKFFKIISEASFIRNESDYNDFYIASKEEAQKQLEDAIEFFEVIENFTNKILDDIK